MILWPIADLAISSEPHEHPVLAANAVDHGFSKVEPQSVFAGALELHFVSERALRGVLYEVLRVGSSPRKPGKTPPSPREKAREKRREDRGEFPGLGAGIRTRPREGRLGVSSLRSDRRGQH